MVYKALQDKFKVKSGKKVLKKKLNQLKVPEKSEKGVATIGCIVDMDQFENADAFYEFRSEFSLKPKSIHIIGYKRNYDKISPFGIQFFTEQHLGWNGIIENLYANEFIGQEYDLLINYFSYNNLLLSLVSASTKARLRVGFVNTDERLNDLILNTSMDDFSTFKTELKKYLTVLGEV